MLTVEEKFLEKVGEGKQRKAVVLLSGGMDSTTLVYDVVSRGYEVYPISFYYGQKHYRELDGAAGTCTKLGLLHGAVDVEALGEIAPSALTRDNMEVPEGHYQEESMKQTVVPNRNMVILALAASYAIGIGAGSVWYGAHGGDHSVYPDCRPAFVRTMRESIRLCDWSRVELRVPYLNWNKERILRRGMKLGVDYSLTWTCYLGGKLACGRCGACVERLEAFGEVGVRDPVEYREEDTWKST